MREERRLHIARFENRIETPRGQFLDLLVRQLDAVPLRNPGADVAHDLLDVHVIPAAGGLVRVLWRAALSAAAVLAPATAVIVRAAARR